MESAEVTLQRGLGAFRDLQARLDPERDSIAELRTAGVSEHVIASLYPFDFATWLPALEVMMTDRLAVARAAKAVEKGGKLGADRLELAGIDTEELNDFYEKFISVNATIMHDLFAKVIVVYTNDFQNLPRGCLGRTPSDIANKNVSVLLDNLALSAWMLAHWREVNSITAEDVWSRTEMGRALLEDALETTLSLFDHAWMRLLEEKPVGSFALSA